MEGMLGRFEDAFPRPSVMGVVNVTPDSFSDGGSFFEPDQAVAQALRLADEGAAIVDVGGESTRPGSEGISLAEELQRVVPVLERLENVPISIDTSKAAEVPGVQPRVGGNRRDVPGRRRHDDRTTDMASVVNKP